jgi:hypothetical protein
MSNQSHWLRLRATFQSALERPAEERDAFLSQACGGDKALRDDVQSLLAAGDAAGTFLETPLLRLDRSGSSPAGAALTLASGDRLGRFDVIDTLGAGGMGEVYRARDTALGREVALEHQYCDAIGLIATAVPLDWLACGDKFLVSGRGTRYSDRKTHAPRRS